MAKKNKKKNKKQNWQSYVYGGATDLIQVSDDFADTDDGNSSKPTVLKSTYTPCYRSHPVLDLGEGLSIRGGSCKNPTVKDFDIYIGFDWSMDFTSRQFPWNIGEELLFEVTDQSVPKDVEEYKVLVDWTIKQLKDGRRVHAGCIGGHGRTGMFFAALVARLGTSDDAIAYVSENYCEEAVESKSQVKFLVKVFGTKTAKTTSKYAQVTTSSYTSPSYFTGGVLPKLRSLEPGTKVDHLPIKGNIWDDPDEENV